MPPKGKIPPQFAKNAAKKAAKKAMPEAPVSSGEPPAMRRKGAPRKATKTTPRMKRGG